MLSDIGYGLSGLGYVVLLLLLFTSRQSGVAKKLLVFATLATACWSFNFVGLLTGPVTFSQVYFSDLGKQFFWLLFVASCLKRSFDSVGQVLKRPETLAILALPFISLILPFFIPLSASWLFLVQTVVALEVLVLLELVYRQAGEEQWAFKPLIWFLGVTQLFEFVLYANATMVNEINSAYFALRGYAYLLSAPLLILATRRIQHWGINIFVSRDIVLHSSLLFVAGIYLFVMALAGYAVSYYEGKWSLTIQVLMVIASGALLATVFLSNHIRTRIKTFITKHFFANQYDYRIEWVKLTKTLSQPTKDLSQAYACALSALLESINYDQGTLLIKKGNYFAQAGALNCTELSEEQRNILPVISRYCEKTTWQLDLYQFLVRPYDYPGLEITKDEVYLFRYQMVIPLFKEQKLWGIFLLNAIEKDSVVLDWEVRDYLTAVTEQIATYLYHHEVAQSLAENAQFAAFSRMSAFVLHDLKNVMAQVDLILCNAQEHKDNPEFIDDTFETLEYTKSRMSKMLNQLTDKQSTDSDSKEKVQLSELIQSVIEQRCQNASPLPVLHIEQEVTIALDNEKLMNVLYHLLSNAQQATPDDGWIKVILNLDENTHTGRLIIEDSGEGMTEEFIQQRLFKPFDTTKGNAGMGIGVYDARNYMESLGGRLEVTSELGKGSQFELVFPLD